MLNRENAGRVLRKLGLALIAAMVFIVMIGAGKVYADGEIELTKEWLNTNDYTLPSGTYFLNGDLEDLPQGLKITQVGADVTLNLNGHTLKLALDEGKFESVIYVAKSVGSTGKVTIKGKDANGNIGKLQGGKGNLNIHNPNEATRNLARGGGIAVSTGTVEIEGVEVSYNTALYGGGVYLCENATFTMDEDSKINYNHIERSEELGWNWRDGAGVFVDNASFYMNGGEVRYNTSKGGWAGIFVGEKRQGENTVVDIRGNARVFTNTGDPNQANKIGQYQNLKMGYGTYGSYLINISNLGDDALFGVYMEEPGKFTVESDASLKDMAKFYSDMDDYVVVRQSDSSLWLKPRSEIENDWYTAKGYEGEYDGKAHGITITVNTDKFQGATVKYGTEVGKYTEDSSPTFMDAGEYTVVYQILADNVQAVMDSKKVKITKRDINKTELTIDYESEVDVEGVKIPSFAYDGTVKAPVPTVTDRFDDPNAEGKVVDPEKEYTVSYQKKNESSGTYEEIAANQVIKAGDYKVVVTSKNHNYTEGSKEQMFKITLKQPKFLGRSLLLGGTIGLNIYAYLPQAEYLDYAESMMTFTVQHEDGSREPIDFTPDPDNQEEVYTFTCFVNSVQMADVITATFNYAYTGTLADETAQPLEATYTVKGYIEEAVASEKENIIAAKPLIKSLADYGHYAQLYLSGLRGWQIPAAHEEMKVFYTTNGYKEDAIKAAKTALADKNVVTSLSSKISQVTYSLYLDTDTAIYLYFKPASNYTDGAEATINGVKTKVYLTADNRFKVVVPNIGAHLLGKEFTVNLKTGNLDNTVTVSAMSYVKAILENPDKTDTDHKDVNAMMALYNYYDQAMKYIGG